MFIFFGVLLYYSIGWRQGMSQFGVCVGKSKICWWTVFQPHPVDPVFFFCLLCQLTTIYFLFSGRPRLWLTDFLPPLCLVCAVCPETSFRLLSCISGSSETHRRNQRLCLFCKNAAESSPLIAQKRTWSQVQKKTNPPLLQPSGSVFFSRVTVTLLFVNSGDTGKNKKQAITPPSCLSLPQDGDVGGDRQQRPHRQGLGRGAGVLHAQLSWTHGHRFRRRFPPCKWSLIYLCTVEHAR